LTTLKHHFSVSNSYVVYRLQLILFPWRYKPWTRRVRRADPSYGRSPGAQGVQGGGGGEWMPPRDDINSPDLYILGMRQLTLFYVADPSHLHPPFSSPHRSLSSMEPRCLRCVYLQGLEYRALRLYVYQDGILCLRYVARGCGWFGGLGGLWGV
jgi:hypothetical protein